VSQVFRRLRRRNKIMFGRHFFRKNQKKGDQTKYFLLNRSFTDL